MDKRKIIVDLLIRYVNGEVDTTSFCDDFVTLYYCESNARELFAGTEREQLDQIATVVSRYSPYKEDHVQCPNAFSDAKNVRETVTGKSEFIKSLAESGEEMAKFKIDATDLRWIGGDADDETDYCLHGNATAKIGDRVLEFNECTVTATALYLLKSLTENHYIFEEEQMLPCCGHFIIPSDDLSSVTISGCNSGIDWSVIHEGDTVRIVLEDDYEVDVPLEEYKSEAFRFADKIESYYFSCSPKKFIDDWDEKGYTAFWNEWKRRRREDKPVVLIKETVRDLARRFPHIEFATDPRRIYDDYVRDLRAERDPFIYHPQEYAGQESAKIVVSQHPIYKVDEVISAPEIVKKCERLQRRYTKEWVHFFRKEKMQAKEVHVCSKVSQEVFDALCSQESIESLRIKWMTGKNIKKIEQMKKLKKLFLECASSVSDISPVAALEDLEVLILGQTEKVIDYSSLAALKKLKVIGICTYQTNLDSTIKVKDLDFLSELPALEYADLTDVRVVGKSLL